MKHNHVLWVCLALYTSVVTSHPGHHHEHNDHHHNQAEHKTSSSKPTTNATAQAIIDNLMQVVMSLVSFDPNNEATCTAVSCNIIGSFANIAQQIAILATESGIPEDQIASKMYYELIDKYQLHTLITKRLYKVFQRQH